MLEKTEWTIHSGTQDTGRRQTNKNTIQKTKKMSKDFGGLITISFASDLICTSLIIMLYVFLMY